MAKTNKQNPLKTFNDNYKKKVDSFNKSLKKFQGDVNGSEVSFNEDATMTKPLNTNIGVGSINLGIAGETSKKGYTPKQLFASLDSKKGISATGSYDINTKDYGASLKKSLPLSKNRNISVEAGYRGNPNTAFDYNKVNAGLNYNTYLGKNKVPVKLGVTYNQKKGGQTKSKKKK